MNPKTSEAKWECVLKLLVPLTAVAAKLFLQEDISARDDILPSTGKSPLDLAFDVIIKFIEGGMKFRARSGKTYEKDLFNFLKTVVRNDFRDLIKSHEYQKTEVIDAKRRGDGDDVELVLEELGDSGSLDGFRSLGAAMVARKVLPHLKDAPELKELVEALLCFDSTKREDVAYALGITPQAVTDRMRKLKKKLAPWRRSVQRAQKGGLN